MPSRRTMRQARAVPMAVPASTWRAAGFRFTKQPQPRRDPIELYNRFDWGALTNPAGNAVVPASGTVTVQVGPSGLGVLWRVTMAALSTTTGANDTSTVTVYAGFLGLPTVVAAQSYAGGGSSAGLNDAILTPGQFVIATWTGAVPGATATLVAYGSERNLIQ